MNEPDRESYDGLLQQRGAFSLKTLPGVGLIFGLFLLGGVAVAVLHFGDLKTFAGLLRSADPGWLAAAAVLQASTYGLDALAWRSILKWYGIRQSMKVLTALALVQIYGNQAVPTGGVAGATLVAAGLRRRGVPAATALSVLFASAIAYLFAYQLLAVVAMLAFSRHSNITAAWGWTLTSFSVGIFVAAGGLLVLLIYGKRILPPLARRWKWLAVPAEGANSLPRLDLKFAGTLSAAVFYQAAILIVDALTLWACAKAAGSPVGVMDAFVAFILASVTATLSPVPMGLGTFEAVSTGLLHLLGGHIESAFAATVAFRIFTLWLPMLPGLILTRRELRGGQTSSAAPDGTGDEGRQSTAHERAT